MQFLLSTNKYISKLIHICRKNKILKYTFLLLLLIVGICSILINFSPTFSADEAFTMGLINHSYSKLINLDAFDVHPPLYYLSLKLFLVITTFWTHSMAIKVIFSRIFSLIISALFIFYLTKLLRECSFKINCKIEWALIIVCPIFIGHMMSIRMYNLSLLLLVLEIYYIFKSTNTHSLKYLYIAAIFTTLNLYTFYIGGFSAMLYLCIPWVKQLVHRNYSNLFYYSKPIILSLILYLPWLPIFFKQYLNHINNDNIVQANPLWNILISVTQSWTLKSILLSLLFYISISIYSYFYINNKLFKSLLYDTLLDVFITLFISLIICKSSFQANTLYPIVFMGIALLISVMVYILQKSNKNKFIILAFLFSLFIFAFTAKSLPDTFHQYKYQSIRLTSNMKSWKRTPNKNIYIYPHNYIGKSGKAFDSAQDAIYLHSINKNAIIMNENSKNLLHGLFNDSHDNKLCKNTFTNMKLYQHHK